MYTCYLMGRTEEIKKRCNIMYKNIQYITYIITNGHYQYKLLLFKITQALKLIRAGFSSWGAWGPADLGSLSGRL